MTNVDKQYNNLLEKIMKHGDERHTRAGDVLSLFGEQLKIDLKAGFPLLTTKKVFTKGIIHELLWFLQRPSNSHGSMNIEYLVRNGVHIWDDDAYRWYREWINKNIVEPHEVDYEFFVCVGDDERGNKPGFEYWIDGANKKGNLEWLINIDKEEFIDLVIQKVEIRTNTHFSYIGQKVYRFGDLGPIYGTQWRSFGYRSYKKIDQIQNIIDTLKTNPNDRRMLCVAYHPTFIKDMALPPCHVMFQFYARKLTYLERLELYRKKHQHEPKFDDDGEPNEHHYNYYLATQEENVDKNAISKTFDKDEIPKYGLSCMYTMRSNDIFLGCPFNIASYALLTHIIAKLANMIPDELVASLGDCHIYKEHIDAVKEQLTRLGSDVSPKLIIHGTQQTIDDFKYSDFEIIDYNPDPPIKAPLLVG